MRPHALVLLLLASGCGVREPGLEVQVSVQVDAPLTLDTATLAIEQLELNPCELATSWWVPLLPISTAWAHGTGDSMATPRRLVAPVLIDLTQVAPQPIGTFAPPVGALCGLTLTFAPSTADAREQGTTLFYEGQGVRQLSTKRVVVKLPFEPLPLDEGHHEQLLTVRLRPSSPLQSGDASLDALINTLRW